MAALAASDVPVARVHALCEDDSVIGTAFYVMEFVEGRVLWDQSLPGCRSRRARRIYDEMNRVIAALHAVDPAAVGLADYGKPRQLLRAPDRRWSKQYQASSDRAHRRDGPPDRLAAGAHARRRRDADRAWRLPARQPDLPPERAAHRRGARLGALDARPSARRLRLPLHGLAHRAGRLPRARRARPRGARHPDRGRVRRGLLPPHRPLRHRDARLGFLPRVQPVPPRGDPAGHRRGRCRAPRRAARRSRWVAAPGRWPSSPGARSNVCNPESAHGLHTQREGHPAADPRARLHGRARLSGRSAFRGRARRRTAARATAGCRPT